MGLIEDLREVLELLLLLPVRFKFLTVGKERSECEGVFYLGRGPSRVEHSLDWVSVEEGRSFKGRSCRFIQVAYAEHGRLTAWVDDESHEVRVNTPNHMWRIGTREEYREDPI